MSWSAWHLGSQVDKMKDRSPLKLKRSPIFLGCFIGSKPPFVIDFQGNTTPTMVLVPPPIAPQTPSALPCIVFWFSLIVLFPKTAGLRVPSWTTPSTLSRTCSVLSPSRTSLVKMSPRKPSLENPLGPIDTTTSRRLHEWLPGRDSKAPCDENQAMA